MCFSPCVFSPCIWVYVWFRFVFVWERMESKYVQEEGPIHILSQGTVNKKKKHPKNNIIAIIIERQRFNSTSKWSVLTTKHKYHVMHTHKKTHMKHITIATNLNGRTFVTRLAQVFHGSFSFFCACESWHELFSLLLYEAVGFINAIHS